MVIVKDVMKTSLVSARPEELVDAVCKRMKQNHLGAVLVMDGKHLVGIFTERDVLNRVVAEDRDPAKVQVKDVCTPNPIAVRGSTSIKSCANILRTKGFRHLPVVDEHRDEMLGSLSDLRNIGEGRDAGALTAAAFLSHFVDEATPWAHLDIAGVAWASRATATCPRGATGFGARLIARALQILAD